MAASIGGRPIRSLRMRGRNDNGEENLPLDLTRDMYILDDCKCDMLDQSNDASLYLHSKPGKDRSPFTILASTRFVRNRFLNSLTLPSKKLRSTSDPKAVGGSCTPTEPKLGGLRRNRTVTEPSIYSSSQGDVFTPVFNGRGLPKSHTVSLETFFVVTSGSVEGSEEQLVERRLDQAGGEGTGLGGPGEPPSREQSSREHLAGGDGGSSSSGGRDSV
ncbi:rapamycin-insensitive companion of mTOR-like isoform 1-T1 [Salvelinus alpinus]